MIHTQICFINTQSNLFDDDDDFLEDESLYLPDDDASQYLTTEPLEQKPWTLTDILQNGIELDHFKVSAHCISATGDF